MCLLRANHGLKLMKLFGKIHPELVTNKLTRVPAAIVRGYAYAPGESGIGPVIRERDKDLFR